MQAFQENPGGGGSRLETSSHQQLEGVPLRTYLFNETAFESRVKEHAAKVIIALKKIATDDFPGLSFDNRVAIITPPDDMSFRHDLGVAVAHGLNEWAKSNAPSRRFEVVTAIGRRARHLGRSRQRAKRDSRVD